MKNPTTSALRKLIIKHIKGGQAFSTLDDLLDKVHFNHLGIIPKGLPYSFYQLFCHIRLAQKDILEYCKDEKYTPPVWPDDFWPKRVEPESSTSWQKLKDEYFNERQLFCDLILHSDRSLLEPFKKNREHNLLRQAELIIEHTAYHTGQLYMIHRLLTSSNGVNN